MTEIRIISTCLVKRSEKADNTFSPNRIESTAWDLQLLQTDYIQKGLLFPKPTSQQLEQNSLGSNVIDHLKISLSKTLDLFPPLAGRLGSQKNNDNTVSLFVDCNNLGAQFTHAIVDNLTMADILEPTYIPPIVFSFFSLYKVPNCDGISQPLLAVQVTDLDDGLFIGCTMNHCVVDGTSFWNFFNAWSEICRGVKVVSNPPVFKPWFPEDVSCPVRIPPWDDVILEKFIPPSLTARVFHFTKESIAKLKAKANSEVEFKTISSFQAFLAHLWRASARHRQLGSGQEIILFLMVGARDRLPLPNGYFGNAAYPLIITSTATELLKNGLGWSARQISKHVAFQTSEEVKKWYVNWIKNPQIPKSAGILTNLLFVSSSPRFNMYGNDFGWGKPVAVRSGVENRYEGKTTLFPGAKEGDIDIEICLPVPVLDAIAKDQEFMEAATTNHTF